VACGPDDSLYLLDRKRSQLRRFDPCTCKFEVVPCTGGQGGGARELRNPGDIAVCGGNLFIADTGVEKAPEADACDDESALTKAIQRENHRISVFSLKGFALRGHLRPPPKELPWRPVSLAFDSLSRAWVVDALGRLHRFAPSGQWEIAFACAGQVAHIAIDRFDHVYVATAESPPPGSCFRQAGRADGGTAIACRCKQRVFTAEGERRRARQSRSQRMVQALVRRSEKSLRLPRQRTGFRMVRSERRSLAESTRKSGQNLRG
jgi:hypothetical protein